MKIQDFINRIEGGCRLTTLQQNNLSSIKKLSAKFSHDAGVSTKDEEPITEQTIVLESAHQPNFLPYPGYWRKIFLLDRVKKKLASHGHDVITVFGFADQNLCTTPLLSSNRIPAFKKGGQEKIGFNFREMDRWKCFASLDKPDHEDWLKEINKIETYYLANSKKVRIDTGDTKKRLEPILELLWQSYDRAKNFPDVNAFFSARLSNELFGLDANFFRYSDVQSKGLFIDECKAILDDREKFINYYNSTIIEKELPITPLSEDTVPFWYHCACGGKINLICNEYHIFHGQCPICGYNLGPIDEDQVFQNNFDRVGFTAVVRNIVFAGGLGSSLFISGLGGGLQYGQIANKISRESGYHLPETLAWASQDCYMGIIHKIGILDIIKSSHINSRDLIDRQGQNIFYLTPDNSDKKAQLQDPKDGNTEKKHREQLRNSATRIHILSKIFSTPPSIVDLLACKCPQAILQSWDAAMDKAPITQRGDFFIMQGAIIYDGDSFLNIHPKEIPQLRKNLAILEKLKWEEKS